MKSQKGTKIGAINTKLVELLEVDEKGIFFR